MSAAIVRANALALPLADESVDTIVTSPPYFALRSYRDGDEHYAGQIGSEPTPQDFLEALWAVTRECWRVLKPSGSLFLNLGDKYAGTGGGNGQTGLSDKSTLAGNGHKGGGPKIRATPRTPPARKADTPRTVDRFTMPRNNTKQTSGFVRAKSLMGLPWRYAIGCTDGMADPDGVGWILRTEIIWSKPNGMPESVTDRPRRSHEQWFHLTKQGTYYADMGQVALERIYQPNGAVFGGKRGKDADELTGSASRRYGENTYGTATRPQTIRAEEIAKQHGLTEEHRAALKARGLGDNAKSSVTKNGTGKNTPEVLRLAAEAEKVLGSYAREFTMNDPAKGKLPDSVWEIATQPLTVPAWLEVDHFAAFPTEWPRRIISAWCPPDGIVLDPFGGTGTTAMVARALGRYGISMDLSADYLRLARWRIFESGQAARVADRTHRDNQGALPLDAA